MKIMFEFFVTYTSVCFGRSKEYLEQTVRELEQTRLGLLSPCHYTGFKATTRPWQAFPDPFVLDTCCKVIEAGKERDRRVI